MKLLISPRAKREIERKAASWAEHSKVNPELFWSELRAVIKRLMVEPYAGRRWVSPSGRKLQRLLLPCTSNHLYYSYYPNKQLIVIRSLWGARRGREPKL